MPWGRPAGSPAGEGKGRKGKEGAAGRLPLPRAGPGEGQGGEGRAVGEEGPGWGAGRGGRVGNGKWGCVTGSSAGAPPGRLRWAHGGVNKLGHFSRALSQVGTRFPLAGPV